MAFKVKTPLCTLVSGGWETRMKSRNWHSYSSLARALRLSECRVCLANVAVLQIQTGQTLIPKETVLVLLSKMKTPPPKG